MLLCFRENKDLAFHLEDDSHEISSLIFSEKNTQKIKIQMPSAAAVISALMDKNLVTKT